LARNSEEPPNSSAEGFARLVNWKQDKAKAAQIMRDLSEGVLTAGCSSLPDEKNMQSSENINPEALRRFQEIERVRLFGFHTPIERCDRLRALIPKAPNICIKRDDYTPFLVGGNKLRKMEYVMAEVFRKKATTMITVGSVQSNHARVMAMVARRFGLKCVLLLNGRLPKLPSGNFLLNSLLGVEIHLVNTRSEREKKMAKSPNTSPKRVNASLLCLWALQTNLALSAWWRLMRRWWRINGQTA
jgi:hypothetical protein